MEPHSFEPVVAPVIELHAATRAAENVAVAHAEFELACALATTDG